MMTIDEGQERFRHALILSRVFRGWQLESTPTVSSQDDSRTFKAAGRPENYSFRDTERRTPKAGSWAPSSRKAPERFVNTSSIGYFPRFDLQHSLDPHQYQHPYHLPVRGGNRADFVAEFNPSE